MRYGGATRHPDIGHVYAIPVRGGGHAICRVLARDGTESFGSLVLDAFTVELATWAEEPLPSLDEALAAETLVLTHYRMFPVAKERPARFRVTGLLPADFTYLGDDRRPRHAPQLHEPGALDWAFLADHVFFERVFRATPETFVKTYVASKRERDRRAMDLMRAKRAKAAEGRRASGLSWPDSVPEAAAREAGRLLRVTAAKLANLRTARAKSNALRECVLALNNLDKQHGGIIDTLVAEEITLTLIGAGEAAGLPSAGEVVESVREF